MTGISDKLITLSKNPDFGKRFKHKICWLKIIGAPCLMLKDVFEHLHFTLGFILKSFIRVKKGFPVLCTFTYTLHPIARKAKVPFNVCGCLNGTIDIKVDGIDKLHVHSFFPYVPDVQPNKIPKPKKLLLCQLSGHIRASISTEVV